MNYNIVIKQFHGSSIGRRKHVVMRTLKCVCGSCARAEELHVYHGPQFQMAVTF